MFLLNYECFFTINEINLVIYKRQEFLDDGNGNVNGILTVLVDWVKDDAGRWKMEEIPGSEKVSC